MHDREYERLYGSRPAEDRGAAAAALAKRLNCTVLLKGHHTLVADPGGAINGQGAFPNLRGLPFWALVDEEGTVTHLKAGEVRSVDEIVAMAEEHLGVSL